MMHDLRKNINDTWKLTNANYWLNDLLDNVLLDKSDRRMLIDTAIGKYSEINRHYHGLYHISFIWAMHNVLSKTFVCTSYLQYSLAKERIADTTLYHDVVYNPKLTDNEARSAELWGQIDGFGAWVTGTIMATANHLAVRPVETDDDRLREWFVGLDLVSMAAPWEVFSLNNKLVRLEYGHVTDSAWNKGRTGFIEKLSGVQIYRDPILHELFEADAQCNITRLLKEGV
jgi:predicted metal-dependent HD superfamily phosphohydrolase